MRPALLPQNCYLVGGAVRDQLLKLPVKDYDWVVTGYTPEQMLAAGFQQVGRDFPVFLHPDTRQEYALARTERKQGQGHTGFICHASPDVTLEQDLLRRDLTINAMAIDQHQHIIDPYHGQQDLNQGVLRHVSDAFIEDPLRVLRVARFAAQLAHYDFTVAPETLALMQAISQSGELATLAKERIWQEWAKALSTAQPERFFRVLESCQALSALSLDINQLDFTSLSAACQLTENIDIRLVALSHRIPNIGQLLALQKNLVTLHRLVRQNISQFKQLDTPQQVLDLLYAIDAYRRPQRLSPFISSCEAIVNTGSQTKTGQLLHQAWQKTEHFRARDLPAGIQGAQIREALYTLRLQRLQE